MSFLEKLFCSPNLNYKRVQAVLDTKVHLTNKDVDLVMKSLKENNIKLDKKLERCLIKIA